MMIINNLLLGRERVKTNFLCFEYKLPVTMLQMTLTFYLYQNTLLFPGENVLIVGIDQIRLTNCPTLPCLLCRENAERNLFIN